MLRALADLCAVGEVGCEQKIGVEGLRGAGVVFARFEVVAEFEVNRRVVRIGREQFAGGTFEVG
ncbi:MAG: hypothetical protein JNL62_15425 [Bryobacterales bacterium]|nr:hypothetical protein [Bryobacterales bacterium]